MGEERSTGALEHCPGDEGHVASDTAAASVCTLTQLASCTSLKTLSLIVVRHKYALTALPDLSALTSPQTLKIWADPHGGTRLIWAQLASHARPRMLRIPQGTARPVNAHVAAGTRTLWLQLLQRWLALTSLQTLNISECRSLKVLPDLSALTSQQTLDLSRCESLTALPDLSALTSLQTLNLWLQLPHGAARPVGAHVAAVALNLRGCS